MSSRTARYLLSSKGKNLLVYDDFIFRRKSKLGGRSYWICAYDRGCRCKARLCVLDGSLPPEILTKSGIHNHAREHGRVEAREMVNTLKRQAIESRETIDQIYTSCVNDDNLSRGGLIAMSNKAAVKAAMRRARLRSSQSRSEDENQFENASPALDGIPGKHGEIDMSDYNLPMDLTLSNSGGDYSRNGKVDAVLTAPSTKHRRKGTPRKVVRYTAEESDGETDEYVFVFKV